MVLSEKNYCALLPGSILFARLFRVAGRALGHLL
jgi:hypothetical protein